MRDFSNVAEKDCVRLIIAQDLKEYGIDVDANLGGGLGNLSCTNAVNNTTTNANFGYHYQSSASNNKTTCQQHSSFHHHHHHHNHSLNTPHCSHHTFSLFHQSSNKHHNKSNISTNLISDLNSNSSSACTCRLNGNQHDSQLSSSISPASSTRVFGISLKQIEHINVMVNDQILTVPSFLKHAIDFINDYIHTEGIFRRNGTASRLKELKKQVEEGVFNFSQFAIFDVTSLIKLFFRELPESLLTFALYQSFIQAVKLETTKSKLESILNLCLQLPDINLNVLIYLMSFLKRVTQQESVNKMNSFNLAVCFAPNIIYTKINKVNDLYINEERIVVQLLIENSSMIGKISESVYERSIMLNSLCSSSTNNMTNNLNACCNGSTNDQSTTNMANLANSSNALLQASSTNNNDLMFLYDNDLQENSSFAHHGQSAGSTSLSSYCGSSKKEKKKRRSSSLKELMNTIQNSISSKFRRRSASEKNDKTTCSIITCSSMTNGVSGSIGGDLSCTSRLYDDKQRFLNDVQTPFISSASNKKLLTTPICSSLYATPRINKRNAEDSLQSTTKKKLMEKLPQRNLLLPNAPITPFSTSKKNKHTFKQILSTTEGGAVVASSSSSVVNVASSSVSSSVSQSQSSALVSTSSKNTMDKQTPQTLTKQSQQATNPNTAALVGLHQKLKYDESPSHKINQSCEMASLKSKYHHPLEKNMSLTGEITHDCRRRLEMLPSVSSSSRHHGSSAASTTSSSSSKSHHHHHHHGSSSSSSHRHHHHHSSSHHHHYHGSSSSSSSSSSHYKHSSGHHTHHHYVNAIPSASSNFKYAGSSSSSNRYINQSDLCTKIISGSYPLPKSDDNNENRLSFSSSVSSSSSSNSSSSASNSSEPKREVNTQKYHNHTSACCGVESTAASSDLKKNAISDRSAIIAPGDNSMRCTLRRGRPNTPKTGLSVDYRIRKSSVPNTPECTNVKSLASNSKVNHTISSNDDIKVKLGSLDLKKCLSKKSKSKTSVVVTLSSSSLNTAMVQVEDDDKMSTVTAPLNTSNHDESRLLDMAFNEDDIEEDASCHSVESDQSVSTESTDDDDDDESESSILLKQQKLNGKNRQLSLSLSNLPREDKDSDNNATSVSDNTDVLLMKKSISSELVLNEPVENNKENNEPKPDETELEQKRDNNSTDLPEITNSSEDQTKPSEQLEQLKQQSFIQFEPFRFKMPEMIPDELKSSVEFSAENATNFLEMDHDSMLQNVLRRQSLFKLKEKINGKVSKHISEIEKRKLSPYRFANSPLKPKKKQDTNSMLLSKIASLKNHITQSSENLVGDSSKDNLKRGSPVRVPSIFCKKTNPLREHCDNEPQFITRPTKASNKLLSTTIATSTGLDLLQPKLPSNSPLITRAKAQFYKKFTKSRSVKRLNATMTPFTTNLSSIADTSLDMSKSNTTQTDSCDDLNQEQSSNTTLTNTTAKSLNKSHNNSPTGKHLAISHEWKCSTESIDL